MPYDTVTHAPPCRQTPILDTDRETRLVLVDVLEAKGFVPLLYDHPEELLADEALCRCPLAFLDMELFESSHPDLLNSLRKAGQLDDAVFMSGSERIETPIRAIQTGAYDYLRKPVPTTEAALLMDRFRARMALREQMHRVEARHLSLIQNVPLLIFVLNDDLQLEFVNHPSQALFGFAPEEAVASPQWLMSRIHPGDRDTVRAALERALQGGPPVSLECRALHRKGRILHGILRTLPVPVAPGDGLRQLEGVFLDITDRIFLERSLVQNEKLKTLGAITAEMAHEFRNPLTAIAGFARLMGRRHPEAAEVGVIMREAQRMEKLLERISDYLQPLSFTTRPCALGAVVADCLELAEPEMDEQGAWCVVDLEESLPKAVADPEVVGHVAVTLLRWCMQRLYEDHVVHIRSYANGPKVCLEVGARMNLDTLPDPETLFLPFEEGGAGLRLPQCHKLVLDMGGVLAFAPDTARSVFTLTLPTAEDPALPMAMADHGEGRPTGARPLFLAGLDVVAEEPFIHLLTRKIRCADRTGRPLALLLAIPPLPAGQPDPVWDKPFLSAAADAAASLSGPQDLPGLCGGHSLGVALPDKDRAAVADLAAQFLKRYAGQTGRNAENTGAAPLPRVGTAVYTPGSGAGAPELLEAARQAADMACGQGEGTPLCLDAMES